MLIDYYKNKISFKLCDFGSASNQIIENFSNATRKEIIFYQNKGHNQRYQAPEILDLYSNQPITEKVDIWSLGMILYSLMFDFLSFNSEIKFITGQNLFLTDEMEKAYSPKLMELLKAMLVKDIKQRISITDVLRFIDNNKPKNKLPQVDLKRLSVSFGQKLRDVNVLIFRRHSTQFWVLKLINHNLNSYPKFKYLKLLVMKAWTKKDKIIKFYKSISNGPIHYFSISALRALYAIHHYIFLGPCEVLNPHHEFNLEEFIDFFSQVWTTRYTNKSYESEDNFSNDYLTKFIISYCEFLKNKIIYHKKYPMVENNYSVNSKNIDYISLVDKNFIISTLEFYSQVYQKFIQIPLLLKQINTTLDVICLLFNEELVSIFSLLFYVIIAYKKHNEGFAEQTQLKIYDSHFIQITKKSEEFLYKLDKLRRENNSMNKVLFFANTNSNADYNYIEYFENLSGTFRPFGDNFDLKYHFQIKEISGISLSMNIGNLVFRDALDKLYTINGNKKNQKNKNEFDFSKQNFMNSRTDLDFDMLSTNSRKTTFDIENNNENIIKKHMRSHSTNTSRDNCSSTTSNAGGDFNLNMLSQNLFSKLNVNPQQSNVIGGFNLNQLLGNVLGDNNNGNNINSSNVNYDNQQQSSSQQSLPFANIFNVTTKSSKQSKPQINLWKGNNNACHHSRNSNLNSNKQSINFNYNYNFTNNNNSNNNSNLDVFNLCSNTSTNQKPYQIPFQVYSNDKNQNNINNNNNISNTFDNNNSNININNNNNSNNNSFNFLNIFSNQSNNSQQQQANQSLSSSNFYQTPNSNFSNINIFYNNENVVNNTQTTQNNICIEKVASDFLKDEFTKPHYQWLISSKNIKLIGNPIGIGGSSIVYRGDFRGTEVAVKKIRFYDYKKENLKEFKREVSSLIMLSHPNLVLFMGAIAEPDNICIVTEFCAGGTLFDLLHRNKDLVVMWDLRLKILLEIAVGMNFLHTNIPPVIHRDLKSLNILLTEKIEKRTDVSKIKISDFGLSKIIKQLGDSKEKMTGQLGTCHWMAPEVIENKDYSIKADVYSYGIIIWEICARKTPYGDMTQQQIWFYVCVKKGRPDKNLIPPHTPKSLITLMEKCWDAEPSNRPSFADIITQLRTMIEQYKNNQMVFTGQ